MTGATHARYVTLAYGMGDAVYRHASMLLLSLLAYAPEPRELVVVTDRPQRFDWFAGLVHAHAIGADQLRAWHGPNRFSMRVKLETARALAPAEGALILLDADTIAIADLSPMPAALAGGALFLHKREFRLGTGRRRGNRALWQQLRGRTFAGWQFQADDAMWNSGVIGIAATDVKLVADALTVYDALAAAGVRHFATEQLVIGLVFGRTGRVREASPWFTHYWGNKAQYDRAIAQRLDDAHRAGLSPAAAADRLCSDPIKLPAEVRPGKLDKLKRWLSRAGIASSR